MKSFMTALLAGVLIASAAGAQTIDRIKETGILKLGYRTDAAPLSFATEDGSPNGYTPNVCVEVAQGIVQILQIENLDVEFVPVTTEDRFEKVAKGEIDLLCGAATITLARRNLVDFSIPVFADGTSVLLPLNGSESFADLAGKKLGVRTGTTTEAALSATLTAAAILAEVVRFEDHVSAMKAMESGELDAYFADQSILAGLWLSSPEQQNLRLGQNLLSIEQHGLAMARGDTDFRLLVDAILSQLYAQGVMQKIFGATMPGIQPGEILRAMFTLAPIPN
ncbi:amino acid ABC transporter substrate-binding protein [Shimia marina]|uniref:Glutamate/aspartate periplasmic-binding protein n=1 Tax=Shimia marina TaxID=321267 RepID=A0A0P1FA71_9RHOB|nr:amino acid ABC transporter substrate-binding protein [Shimia marina]CUH51561.1 Glutamate/aspartate periplasmic-binding protein precursor [Shimia marina]SFD46000.1 amino acid ABC transporter substrate-binding protein, PAAT family [Shimia marina]